MLLVVAAVAQETLAQIPSLLVLIVLAVAALVWLRRVIHLGLLQESREIPVGDPITCPNCSHVTPLHTFCGHCGISLRALPKARNAAAAAPVAAADLPERQRLGWHANTGETVTTRRVGSHASGLDDWERRDGVWAMTRRVCAYDWSRSDPATKRWFD